jgi:hypothetical protein
MKNGLKAVAFTLVAMSISAMDLLAQSSEPAEALSHRHCSGVFLKQPIVALNDTGITGEAKLCLDANGVRSELAAKNLTPGYIYIRFGLHISISLRCA